MKRPTPEEVTTYAFFIGFKLNGEHFCDYYESKGWLVGKAPMKDWKAAVRTWKHNSPSGAMVGARYDYEKGMARQEELDRIRQREMEKREKKAQELKLELL